MKKVFGLFLILAFPFPGIGQDIAKESALTENEMLTGAALVVLGFTVLLVFVLVLLLIKLKNALNPLIHKTEEEELYDKQDLWSKLFQLRPLAFEGKLVMDHSYDGIEELDNPTPPWFMFLFYSTILFGAIYWVVYHALGDGKIMENEYAAQVKDAEIVREIYLKKFANSVNESNVTLVTKKNQILEGKQIYDNNCVACHSSGGEGKVGPNLTDDYYLHGAGIKNIFHTVSEGVPEKGMIAWKKQLNPLQIQLVSSYVITLKGTNPANPKAPQGVKEGTQQAGL